VCYSSVLLRNRLSRLGVGYRVFFTSRGWPSSTGSPSSTHAESPPFMMLDFWWPYDRNMKRARGEEKIPALSYLLVGKFGCREEALDQV